MTCLKLVGGEVEASGTHFKWKKDSASNNFSIPGEPGMAF